MARPKRANGAGSVYTKHGNYYGRWLTPAGGHTNRMIGPVRRPGSRQGLTRTQAEKRLRELMATAVVERPRDPELTIARAGRELLEHLEARGRSKSHIETVESHLRVHLQPFFGEKSLDRITHVDVTRLLARLRRSGRAPKTARNVLSTVHSLFDLAVRRGWMAANPCKLVDAPEVQPSTDIRFLTHAETGAASPQPGRRLSTRRLSSSPPSTGSSRAFTDAAANGQG